MEYLSMDQGYSSVRHQNKTSKTISNVMKPSLWDSINLSLKKSSFPGYLIAKTRNLDSLPPCLTTFTILDTKQDIV